MKARCQKKSAMFIGLLILLIIPLITFADCNKQVYERPKMQWYLDKCGQWHQGYPEDDDNNKNTSNTYYEKFDNYD